MSDTPQGPGWWLASDGRYYPPEQHPSASQPGPTPPAVVAPTTPPPGPGVPPPGPGLPPSSPVPPGGPLPGPGPVGPGYAPGYATGPAVKKKGNTGCVVAIIVVLVLFVGGGIAAVVLVNRAASNLSEAAFGSTTCSYLSNQDASAALGGQVDVIQTGGVTKLVDVIDPVLVDGTSCLITKTGSTSSAGQLARTSRLQTSSAADRYQTELRKAKGISTTVQSNANSSLSTESLPYFDKEVTGLGDEAFCTSGFTGGAGLPGVLVRKGDVLVYAAASPDYDSIPSTTIDLTNPSVPKLDASGCDRAQALARKIVG